jgi:hypothetical protein
VRRDKGWLWQAGSAAKGWLVLAASRLVMAGGEWVGEVRAVGKKC